jgi:hypothetical protein
MTRKVRLAIPLGLLAALALACSTSDSPTMPTTALRTPESALLARGGSNQPTAPGHPDTVLVLRRIAPLAGNLTASATIGPAGGELRIPAAGVVFTVPAGALASPTVITISARGGNMIAYDFAPHGLVFRTPATLTQDMRATSATTSNSLFDGIVGAYYDGDLADIFVDPAGVLAKIAETRPAVLDRGRRSATIYINHFSGYLMSSGRSLASDE